jgi:death-on-curing protein
VNYLTEEEIVEMNFFQIDCDSPMEQKLVKEPESLSAIVASMRQEFFGVTAYPTIEEKASVLYVGLIIKQVFGNANKRTAVMALDIFLMMNGIELVATEEELLNKTVAIAENHDENTISEVAKWIEQNIEKDV